MKSSIPTLLKKNINPNVLKFSIIENISFISRKYNCQLSSGLSDKINICLYATNHRLSSYFYFRTSDIVVGRVAES